MAPSPYSLNLTEDGSNYNPNDSFLLRHRMEYWSKRFDELALKHHVSYITEVSKQRRLSEDSLGSSYYSG